MACLLLTSKRSSAYKEAWPACAQRLQAVVHMRDMRSRWRGARLNRVDFFNWRQRRRAAFPSVPGRSPRRRCIADRVLRRVAGNGSGCRSRRRAPAGGARPAIAVHIDGRRGTASLSVSAGAPSSPGHGSRRLIRFNGSERRCWSSQAGTIELCPSTTLGACTMPRWLPRRFSCCPTPITTITSCSRETKWSARLSVFSSRSSDT